MGKAYTSFIFMGQFYTLVKQTAGNEDIHGPAIVARPQHRGTTFAYNHLPFIYTGTKVAEANSVTMSLPGSNSKEIYI